jgi:hypothetical protein
MKNKFLKYFALAAVIAVMSACERDLEKYNAGSGLNFYYQNSSDTLVTYSFVYGSTVATSDTVWLKVQTMGFLSDEDREINVEQIATGISDAVAGTHYLSFDDASLKSYYIMPAGKSLDSIPVVLLRDASLKDTSVNLLIKIKTNSEFTLVNSDKNTVQVVFTDKLSKPSCWAYYAEGYFGTYGPVKHQWLIEQTGEKWDDDYLYNVLGFTSSMDWSDGTNAHYDSGYCSYLSTALTKKLDAYNAARTAAGLDVLKEADGTVVSLSSK